MGVCWLSTGIYATSVALRLPPVIEDHYFEADRRSAAAALPHVTNQLLSSASTNGLAVTAPPSKETSSVTLSYAAEEGVRDDGASTPKSSVSLRWGWDSLGWLCTGTSVAGGYLGVSVTQWVLGGY